MIDLTVIPTDCNGCGFCCMHLGTPPFVNEDVPEKLQLDGELVTAFHDLGFEVAIETNGTRLSPPGIDWICVSPKAGADLVLRSGQELKLVYPQAGAEPERFEGLDFRYFFLQPMDGPDRERHTSAAVRYCLDHPRWRLSLQIHKYLGMP